MVIDVTKVATAARGEGMINISVTNGNKIIHIGCYADRVTADRIKRNLKYFVPNKGEWKLWE